MEYPEYLIRPDDGEPFLHVGNGFYSLKCAVEEFPNNLHFKYAYEHLKNLGFYPPGDGGPPIATATSDDDPIRDIGDRIANLTLKQAAQLKEYLNNEYNITSHWQEK